MITTTKLRDAIATCQGPGIGYDATNRRLQNTGTSVGGTQVSANKDMVASVTTSDGNAACAVAMQATPISTFVGVDVNGVEVVPGNGVKTGVPCYFSGDNGATARAYGSIAIGDKLYWNGSVAGYQLSAADRVSFHYEV